MASRKQSYPKIAQSAAEYVKQKGMEGALLLTFGVHWDKQPAVIYMAHDVMGCTPLGGRLAELLRIRIDELIHSGQIDVQEISKQAQRETE